MNFGNLFKTFGPRLIGIVVSGIAGLIVAKTKGAVSVDSTQVTEIVVTMLGAYAASHRATSAVINPGDAAEGRVAGAIDKAANDPSAPETVIVPPPPAK